MHRELGERGGQAGNRGWVGALVASDKCLGAAGGLVHGRLPWRLVDAVKDRPVGGLDLGLGGVGTLASRLRTRSETGRK